jgi:Cof subfamily protein (haloacid dehalogenase superfamily)
MGAERGARRATTREEVRTLALDLDGTLAGADHRVSARSADVLRRLERRGLPAIIITGRTTGAALRVWREAGLSPPVISCNGAVVTDPASGARLRERVLDPETVRAVLEVADDTGLTPTLWTAERMYAPRRNEVIALMEELNQEKVALGPLDALVGAPVVKAMVGGPPQHLDAVSARVNAALPTLLRSMDTFFETSDPEAGKAQALELVLAHLGIPPAACLGVGDGDTDADWLRLIGHPVAVANARPAVHAVASHVIGHHADDAVAAFLEATFDAARGGDAHGG